MKQGDSPMSPKSAHPRRPRRGRKSPVYVLGATTAGLAVMRSLGRRGIPVFALESPPRPPGHYSRYARPILLPDFRENEGAWLDRLLLCADGADPRPVLIPAGDDEVLFVARHRRLLAERFRFNIPNDDALSVACDKALLYRFAAETGVPVPETRFPEGPPDEANPDPGEIGFPCLVKPTRSHLWRRRGGAEKLAVARDRHDLERLYRKMWRPGEPLMIQEIVPGGDNALYGYLSCWDRRSRPLVLFTKRKLRQHPVHFGNGSLQVSERNETTAEQSILLLSALAYSGVASIEYKRDDRDGSFKLLDLNPRTVSGEQLAVDSGVDIPYIHYLDVIGEDAPATPPFREGVKYVHLSWDVQSLLSQRKKGTLPFHRWLLSLAGVRSFALLSLSDPAPSLVLLGRASRLGARKIAAALPILIGRRRGKGPERSSRAPHNS